MPEKPAPPVVAGAGGFPGCSPARLRVQAACLRDSITSSLTLTTCPGWPGSERRRPAGRFSPGVSARSSPGLTRTRPAGVCFMLVTDPKTVKNRVHLDLTSSVQDRDQEIERLLALGARRVIRPKETLTR